MLVIFGSCRDVNKQTHDRLVSECPHVGSAKRLSCPSINTLRLAGKHNSPLADKATNRKPRTCSCPTISLNLGISATGGLWRPAGTGRSEQVSRRETVSPRFVAGSCRSHMAMCEEEQNASDDEAVQQINYDDIPESLTILQLVDSASSEWPLQYNRAGGFPGS